MENGIMLLVASKQQEVMFELGFLLTTYTNNFKRIDALGKILTQR